MPPAVYAMRSKVDHHVAPMSSLDDTEFVYIDSRSHEKCSISIPADQRPPTSSFKTQKFLILIIKLPNSDFERTLRISQGLTSHPKFPNSTPTMCHNRTPRCSTCNRRGAYHRRNCTAAYPAAQSNPLPPSYDMAMSSQTPTLTQYPSTTHGCGSRRRCGHGCGYGNRRQCRGSIRMLVSFLVQYVLFSYPVACGVSCVQRLIVV